MQKLLNSNLLYYKTKKVVKLKRCKMSSSLRILYLMKLKHLQKVFLKKYIRNIYQNHLSHVIDTTQTFLQNMWIKPGVKVFPDCVWWRAEYFFTWPANRLSIDPFHKWLPIINSFVIIKISLTNLVFELIIQKSFYSQTSLVRLI